MTFQVFEIVFFDAAAIKRMTASLEPTVYSLSICYVLFSVVNFFVSTYLILCLSLNFTEYGILYAT
jgi:hypothetical protein